MYKIKRSKRFFNDKCTPNELRGEIRRLSQIFNLHKFEGIAGGEVRRPVFYTKSKLC